MATAQDNNSSITEAELNHAVLQETLPVLNDLQASIKAAMEATEPLADACYRVDVLDTVRELTAHFVLQARLLNQQASG